MAATVTGKVHGIDSNTVHTMIVMLYDGAMMDRGGKKAPKLIRGHIQAS